MLLSTLFVTGCGATAALMLVGPVVQGVMMWENGEGHKFYQYNYKVVYRATKQALKNLNIPISDEQLTDTNGYITAGSRSQYKIKINFVENNICELCIRVNFMGNKEHGELIYQNVDQSVFIINYENGLSSNVIPW